MTATDFGPAFANGIGYEFFRTNPQAQQFVSMLSAVYRNAAPLYDPDNALLKDPNAWGHVLRDDRFRAFIQQRLAKVARIAFVIEPSSDREEDVYAAATCDQFMREVPGFTSARRHLAKFAFWGRSHAWIEGRREWRIAGKSETFPDGFLGEWWSPTFIRPLDKRQVIYQSEHRRGEDGANVVHVKTLLGTIDAGKHVEMQHPECLITCVYDDEVERLGHGRGLLETMYHAYWIKGVVRRIGLSGLEKWAHGVVVGMVDAAAHATTDTDAQAAAAALLTTIQAMRAGGAIVLDSRDKVEVVKSDGAGQDATMKWFAYIDEGVSQLCLSSVRTMGGKDAGPYKAGEVEAESSEDLLDCDRELIDEQITRSIVRLWWDLNAANLAAMGLGAARCPVFRSRGLRDEDPEKVARTLESAQRLGMQIPADEAHRRLRIKRPAPGEDVLEAPKPAAPDIFGGFGGEGGAGGGRPEGVPRSDMPENGGEELGAIRSFLAMLKARGLRLVRRREAA